MSSSGACTTVRDSESEQRQRRATESRGRANLEETLLHHLGQATDGDVRHFEDVALADHLERLEAHNRIELALVVEPLDFLCIGQRMSTGATRLETLST